MQSNKVDSRIKTWQSFVLFLLFFLCTAPLSYANGLKLGNSFFYANQYDKAIQYYLEAIKSNTENQANINYKIGLSYFLKGDSENSLKFWQIAKEENRGIFKGRIFRIPASGMSPTLIVGDNIIIDPDYYKNKEVARGDVIAFLSPEDTNKIYIKRVIGLPGDKVAIKNRIIELNGSTFADLYAVFKKPLIDTTTEANRKKADNFEPVVVPKDNYFVLGDNRNISHDSRYFGFVNKEYILGKALAIYFSAPNRVSMDNARPERAGLIIQ